MLSPLRNRFGIPGVISVVALVFAMLGGAYAASSNDNGKATASAKAKKGPRGPKGATGPAGPAGAQGPAGANGKDGSNGANGANGVTGAAGTTGKSVATGTATALQCPEGGITVEVEGSGVKKPVCNGEAGTPGNQGTPGSPWTAGGTLPVGSTETGTYAFSGPKGKYAAEPGVIIPISFPIPLASASTAVYVPGEGDNPDPTHCPGTVEDPEATSGYLCVYQQSFGHVGLSAEPFFVFSFSVGANLLYFSVTEESPLQTSGTWAVTG